jgi:hypothetical protein
MLRQRADEVRGGGSYAETPPVALAGAQLAELRQASWTARRQHQKRFKIH